MKKILLTLILLTTASVTHADIGNLLPRSVVCNAYPQVIGAGLNLANDGVNVKYVGYANDNFDSVDIESCVSSKTDIKCEGTWRFAQSPFKLVIKSRKDGTFYGRMQLASGSVIVGCLLSDNPLQ